MSADRPDYRNRLSPIRPLNGPARFHRRPGSIGLVTALSLAAGILSVCLPRPGTDETARQTIVAQSGVLPAGERNTGAGAAQSGTPTYGCLSFGPVSGWNPTAQVLRDEFAWLPKYRATKVGDGTGDVDWRADPYRQNSWRMWLHSLRWLGEPINAGRRGDGRALEHAARIARDWVRDNPYSWHHDKAAWEPTMHRANVLVCLRETLAQVNGGRLPDRETWIDQALTDHAHFLETRFAGNANHGTDESITLLGIGCLQGDQARKDLALSRLREGLNWAIDADGATNEQSTGYAYFNWSLWQRAQQVLATCDADRALSDLIQQRRDALARFLAHATNPLGRFHQIGDTDSKPVKALTGTEHEFATTVGAAGARPSERVASYRWGYVFGRSGWGDGHRPVAEEAGYSVRFGPRARKHGHADHTSITYLTRGAEVLVDPGYGEYTRDRWQDYYKGPAAHNQVVFDGMRTDQGTALKSSRIEDGADFFELFDIPVPGGTRSRSVLFVHDPDLVFVDDRVDSPASTTFQQLWHLPADQQVSTSQIGAVAQAPGNPTRTHLIELAAPDRPDRSTTDREPPASPLADRDPAGTGTGTGRGHSGRLGFDRTTTTTVATQEADATPRLYLGSHTPVQGWVWPTFFQKVAAPVVSFERQGRQAQFVTTIVPAAAEEPVTVTSAPGSADATIYTVQIGSRSVQIELSPDGQLRRR